MLDRTSTPSSAVRGRIGRFATIALVAGFGAIAAPVADAASPPPACVPSAANDSYSVVAGSTLQVGAPGVMANDDTCGGVYANAHLYAQVANGSLNLNNNGSFSYTPDAGFVGTDSFQYTLQNFPMGWRRAAGVRAPAGGGGSNVATVTITVTEPPPTTPAPGPTTTAPGPTTTGPAGTDPDATPVPGGVACSEVPTPAPLDQDADPWPHGQVIAQGIVEFGEGSLVWHYDELTADGWPFGFASTPPVFFAADGPDAVLVSSDDAPWSLLDAGEATFVPAGASGAIDVLVDTGVAAGHRITMAAGSGVGAFAPGAGLCDVNLIRDVVQPDEVLEVSSLYPVLVVVTAGAVVDTSGSELVAGDVATLGGGLQLRNDGDETAVVLVAAIGGGVPG